MRMDREDRRCPPAAAGVPRSNSRERQTPSPATSEAEGASAGFEAPHLMQAMRERAAPAVAAAAARHARTHPPEVGTADGGTARLRATTDLRTARGARGRTGTGAGAGGRAGAGTGTGVGCTGGGAGASAVARRGAERLGGGDTPADAQPPPPTATAGRLRRRRAPGRRRRRRDVKAQSLESRDATPLAAGGKATKPASPPPGHPAYVPGRDLSKERPAAAAATTTPAAAQGSAGSPGVMWCTEAGGCADEHGCAASGGEEPTAPFARGVTCHRSPAGGRVGRTRRAASGDGGAPSPSEQPRLTRGARCHGLAPPRTPVRPHDARRRHRRLTRREGHLSARIGERARGERRIAVGS